MVHRMLFPSRGHIHKMTRELIFQWGVRGKKKTQYNFIYRLVHEILSHAC